MRYIFGLLLTIGFCLPALAWWPALRCSSARDAAGAGWAEEPGQGAD